MAISSSSSIHQGIPKTIEGATERYLRSYENQFRGQEEDKKRLKTYATTKILALRKKAPKFFEERLPTLVNQAASALLVADTSTSGGLAKFHDTHCQFLRVLDELKRSQPANEINFQTEYDRFKEKEQLIKKHIELRTKLHILEATELPPVDVDWDQDAAYNKVVVEIDKTKEDLKRVAKLIARMECENIEEEIEFKLKVVPRSTLDRLSPKQLEKLESLIEKYYLDNKRNKRAMYVDKSIIDGMIAQLGVDTSKFTQVDINQLSKDALDAYRTFFRDLENAKRDEYHNDLLSERHLRPKQGIVLENPDDIPEEMRQKLADSKRKYERTLEDCFEEFANKPANEDVGYDDVNDEEGGASGEDEVEVTYLQKHQWLFNRIKEEPREDYEDDAPSDNELIVNDKIANELDQTNVRQADQSSPGEQSAPSPPNQSPAPSPQEQMAPSLQEQSAANPQQQVALDSQPGNKRQKCEELTDDGFLMLGVVEPTDKVECIIIEDD